MHFPIFLKLRVQSIIFLVLHEIEAAAICFVMERGRRKSQQNSKISVRARIKLFYPVEACLTHPNRWMIGRSKELEDVGRVASSFPTNLAKIKATLLAGYKLRDIVPKRSDQVLVSAVAGIKQSVKDDERCQFRVFFFQPPVV